MSDPIMSCENVESHDILRGIVGHDLSQSTHRQRSS